MKWHYPSKQLASSNAPIDYYGELMADSSAMLCWSGNNIDVL